MKNIVRNFIYLIVSQDYFWLLTPKVLKSTNYVRVQRNLALENRFKKLCKSVFNFKTVRSGPFLGLIYCDQKALGSAFYPKLLGSYESELHYTIEKLLKNVYSLIIDIGFAEGYYLVGLANRIKEIKIVGYDISSDAHEQCKKMILCNKTNMERITLLKECSVKTLSPYLPSRSLIICDCEGFENELFDFQFKNLWLNSDLIVECHDFIVEKTQDKIVETLSSSHKIKIIRTAEIEDKLNFLSSENFSKFTEEDKKKLLNEGRPVAQNWIVAEAINFE